MKLLLGILVIAVLAVGGAGYGLLLRDNRHLTTDNQQLSTQVAQAQAAMKQLKEDNGVLQAEREKMETEVRKLAEQVTASAKALNAAREETKAALAKAEEKPASIRGGMRGIGTPESTKPMKALSEMMKYPAMREMAKQQQIAMMDMQYAGLFAKFQLNDEEKANFKELISQRLSAETDMGLKLMDESITPEQRKAVLQEANDLKAENDEKIRTFLNSDTDYNTFRHWEDTKGERMQMTMGKSAFAEAPLSPDQETQLVDLMHTQSLKPSNVPNMNKPENFDPRKFTQADIDKQLAKYERDQADVRAQAAAFLNPQQRESLKKMQEQALAMMKASMSMAKTMFNNGGK